MKAVIFSWILIGLTLIASADDLQEPRVPEWGENYWHFQWEGRITNEEARHTDFPMLGYCRVVRENPDGMKVTFCSWEDD